MNTYVISERDHRYTKWKMAVQRSLGWAIARKTNVMTGMLYDIKALDHRKKLLIDRIIKIELFSLIFKLCRILKYLSQKVQLVFNKNYQ